MKHKPLVFIDIETTGMSPLNSRVLEIGALRVEDGNIVKTYKKLLAPDMPIPWFISRLTGITDEMVWESPKFMSVADELEVLFDDAIFIAHNVNFDYNFIKMEFDKLGRKFNMDRLCTVKLSRALYPRQLKHNLDTIIKTHGFKVESRHRAYDDAFVLYEFYKKALDQHGLKAYSAMNRILTKSYA